jgi:hypothetical protein
MQRLSTVIASCYVVGAVGGLLLGISSAAAGQALELNLNVEDHVIHIFPTVHTVKALAVAAHNGGTPPLLYHGGPVLLSPTVYAIFWVPPHLQDGHATSLSSAYQNVQTTLLNEYFGHAIGNNNTQYYQIVGTTKSYIQNKGSFGGSYVDTSLYPGSDCFDPSNQLTNGNNCISDTDLRNEITKVMGIKGWTGGMNKVFLLFTSSNEGQCAVSKTNCSYVQYCGYHSYFINRSNQTVIYTNQPYGNPTACQISGAPSPNSNPAADTAATAVSHELSESITDPLINAWKDSSGSEIGDECAYYYGLVGWNGGHATELWDGHPFLLQTEYSNYLQNFYFNNSNFTGCFNSGPEL